MTFAGFPARSQATAIPNVFFSDVLPRLAGDPAAVGVALYAFRLLLAKRGSPRHIHADELAADHGLRAFLAGAGIADEPAIEAAVERGLARAVDAAVLLGLTAHDGGPTLYFLNAPADRRAMESMRAAASPLEGASASAGRVVPFRPATERAAIFALYEQEIGTITPQIAEELIEAERLYPQEWIERAMKEASVQNARSWRYVQRILERWAVEGPDHATTERDPAAGERYFRGKYGSVLRRRLDG